MAHSVQTETVCLIDAFDEEHQNDPQVSSSAKLEISLNAITRNNVENAPPDTNNLTLPPGKSFHMFVSHSGDDSEEVWGLIRQLETRYQVRCMYADRDFQPGKDITDNIKENIEISMKILLILTPSYLDSGYCWFEQKVAFQRSITQRQNCLIPLILKPFEGKLPSALSNLTYIDAQKEPDLPARVYEALVSNGTRQYYNYYRSINLTGIIHKANSI